VHDKEQRDREHQGCRLLHQRHGHRCVIEEQSSSGDGVQRARAHCCHRQQDTGGVAGCSCLVDDQEDANESGRHR